MKCASKHPESQASNLNANSIRIRFFLVHSFVDFRNKFYSIFCVYLVDGYFKIGTNFLEQVLFK